MTGPFFSFEPSLYFLSFVGCSVLLLLTLSMVYLKRAGFKTLSLAVLLLAAGFFSQFLIFAYQEKPLLMRLMEQCSVLFSYLSSLAFYVYLVRLNPEKGKDLVLDSFWFRGAFTVLVLALVFLTPYAVSDRLSYLKGLNGSAYYITDYALLAPVNLIVPFLLLLAGILKGQKRNGRISLTGWVLVAFISIAFILQGLFIFGLLRLSVMRNAWLMGMAVNAFILAVSAVRNGPLARQKAEEAAMISGLREKLSAQEPLVGGNLTDISRGIEKVLGTADELKQALTGNEIVFSGLFNLLKESFENRERQTETFGKREDLITELQNDTGNRSLLVPLMLERWQGFFNEVQGITGNSSDIAQSIDKLISSTDNGKVLIQDHLKATNNIRLSADKVRFIVGLINDISEQTNILSINAAIEAYRAGIHGRGFSIIADEIRQVATTTLEESNAISECIGRILENSRAEEALVKENDAIYNDFSKTMERLFVYILNVIEVAKELRAKMEMLLNDIRELQSSIGVSLQQEQMRQGNFIRETKHISQFIEDGDRLSEDLFQLSSFFAEIESIRKKHGDYVRLLEDVRAGIKGLENQTQA